MNNNRGVNQNNARMFPNGGAHFASVSASNPAYLITGQHRQRHYATTHNVGEMKNNHMPNMAHGLPMVQIPRQQTVYHIPPSTVFQGGNQFYHIPPQASQPTLIMPYVQNYSANQSGMYYSTHSRSIPMANMPQGPQNPPVANMNNAQNSHGSSIIVSQPMEMATNAQPLQVPQQPSATPLQPTEPRPRRKKTAIKIIDPATGNEVVVDNTTSQTSVDDLEKMKVQSQFQSQVQSAVKKDDTKVSDDNQNNEGGEKVKHLFQSQVLKLIDENSTPPKTVEIHETQITEDALTITSSINKYEEINCTTPSIEEVVSVSIVNSNVDSNDVDLNVIDLTLKTEEVLNVNECAKETTNNVLPIIIPTNTLPNTTQTNNPLPISSPTLEVQAQNIDNTIIVEENHTKKNIEEESSKPGKNRKTKSKKKKNQSKDNEDISIVQPSIIEAIEPITNTQENKENENDNHNSKNEEEESIQKPEEISLSPQETQNNGVQHETTKDITPKLPSYLENLPYAEGQWSATNPTGKKVYSKSFLIKLGSEAICQKKPDVLANWVMITKLSNSSQYGSLGGMVPNFPRSQSASATGFMPAYVSKSGNNSQRGMTMMQPGAKRNSSQGKTPSKTAKPTTIHMSLSLREEVKLNQTENAWVPTAAKKATKIDVVKNKNEDELKTEDVNKNVRSILNKITPDNRSALTDRFKALPIDTYERLEKTIDLVFEKAIEEQSFAPLYASLCSAMQTVQVVSAEGAKMSFKKLIISKCQSLFELDKAQETDSAKKLAEINSCKDPEKKKELQLVYEENERRLRKRSVGNCRFIGELFKQKILTPNIMLYCIVNLVTKHVEEPLECLCNLLKTVGKELEQSYNLNETFDKLRALTSKEMKSKIPSRIRFMIQDVIDLRRDKWIPRRNDSKPKLINEIENDAKNEAMEQSMALSYRDRSEKPRDHHRGDDNKFRGGDNKSRRGNDSEWNIVQNTKYKQQSYTIDQSKLQGFKDNLSIPTLQPSSKWSFTNSGSSKSSTFTSNNTYAALNDDKKSSNSQIMSSKNTPRKPVISDSEERQRMLSGVQSMMPQFAQTILNTGSSQVSKESIEEPVIELDPEVVAKINSQCKSIILEYEQMHNLDDVIFLLTKDESSAIRTRHEDFVRSMSLITLDSTPNSRTEAGRLFSELLSKKVISMSAITQGIDGVLKDWNDYLVDYPQFFSYIAAIITPLLISKTASFEFNNLKDACSSIRPDNSSVLFIEILQKILSSKETQNIKEDVGGILWMYNKWKTPEYVSLDTFMPTTMLNKYFKNDRLGVFLLSIALYDRMRLTDGKLFYEIMLNWINLNISVEIIKCPQFVRALTIAIVIICLKPNHSFEDFFELVHIKLMTCFIRSEPLPEPEIQAREVECLYGIQIMSATLEHPGGMVLKLFHKLYQDSIISRESFYLWKKEEEFKPGFDEDLETKTMAVVVLNSFFISLTTNDSDDDEVADQ